MQINPVSLWLDTSYELYAGKAGTISWVLENVSKKLLVDFSIKLQLDHSDNEVVVSQYKANRHALKQGERVTWHQNARATIPGKRAIGVEVLCEFEDGQHFRLLSSSQEIFNFKEIKKGRILECEAECSAVDQMFPDSLDLSEYDSIKVRYINSSVDNQKSPDIIGMQVSETKSCLSSLQGAHVDLSEQENLKLIPLRLDLHIDALYPHVNIDKLSTSWPGLGDLQLDFVDENKQKRKASCEVGDHFIVEIKSQRKTGYLTLLSQGSSGEFYVLAPHDWMDADKFRMEAGVARYWYGDLFPLPDERFADWVEFNEAGVERVFALLTQDKPLIPSPLIPNPKPVSKMSEEEVRAILQEALTRSGTSFALAKVTVVTPANAWARNK